jgi:primosomal protein N' (replication factor Y)
MQLNVFVLARPYNTYAYESDSELALGTIILVPFGKKDAVGIVWENTKNEYNGNIKSIIRSTGLLFSEQERLFIKKASLHTLTEIGAILNSVFTAEISKKLHLIKHYALNNLNSEDNVENHSTGTLDKTLLNKKFKILLAMFEFNLINCKSRSLSSLKIQQACSFQQKTIDWFVSNSLLVEVQPEINNLGISESLHTQQRDSYKSSFVLSEEQNNVFNGIMFAINSFASDINTISDSNIIKAKVDIQRTNKNKPILLQGVTGSGKTEVYFKVISTILQEANNANTSAQILILLPEITLADQIHTRFVNYFGITPILWHSNENKDRFGKWVKTMNGTHQVIIGTRSAIFLPFDSLRLIIMDEEHDSSSYKQESGIVYHTRDLAIIKAKSYDANIILTSATPSIETLFHTKEMQQSLRETAGVAVNVESDMYQSFALSARYKAILPQIHIIDMNNTPKKQWICQDIRKAIVETMAKNQQTFLFLNRKGYAPILFCSSCRYSITCENCSSHMTMYKSSANMICSYCNNKVQMPNFCSNCNAAGDKLIPCGPGIERIVEELRTFLPQCTKITEITGDTENQKEIIEQVINNETQIIVGTQIIAKGHTFPMLTLVCILDADAGMYGGDMRAAEKTYQLLTQVAGRAGRVEHAGRVYIQTRFPQSQMIQSLQNSHKTFIEGELYNRFSASLPPFSDLISIIITSSNEIVLKTYCHKLEELAPIDKNIEIMGPTKCQIYLMHKRYRMCFLIKTLKTDNIQHYDNDNNDMAPYEASKHKINNWLLSVKRPSNITMKIDINPYYFA